MPLDQPRNRKNASCGDGTNHHHPECTTYALKPRELTFEITENKQAAQCHNRRYLKPLNAIGCKKIWPQRNQSAHDIRKPNIKSTFTGTFGIGFFKSEF